MLWGYRDVYKRQHLRHETIRLGQDHELKLRIGYLRCYSGQELHQAVAEFSETYPEVSIDIVNGTHEELYDLLRFGGVDPVSYTHLDVYKRQEVDGMF